MFDVDRFVEDCLAAQHEADSQKAVREVLASTLVSPRNLLAALGEPTEAGAFKLYHGPTITVLNVIWAPLMTLKPHNHNMWALIGIYTGREDNIFWRRDNERVEAAGAKALCEGDIETLGEEIVHSVTNPLERYTGAIHIYGGDFFAANRSEWDAETLTERPFDLEKNMRQFQEADARFVAGFD